jgi:two-component system, NarL family, sensor kinase
VKKLLFFFLLCPLFGISQNKTTVDSLKTVVANPAVAATHKIDALNGLALVYAKTDSALTYKYALDANARAEKLHYIKGQADHLSAIGLYHSLKGNIAKTLNILGGANQLYTAIKDDNAIGRNYNFIGNMYKQVNKIPDAISYFTRALTIHKEKNSIRELATNLIDLGSCYIYLDQKEKGVAYYIEAGSYADKLKDGVLLGRICINIANVLRDLKNYNQAFVYYDKAITIFKRINDQLNLGVVYLNVSIVYANLLQYDVSEKYLKLSIAAFSESKYAKGLLFCNNNLGGIYIRQGNYEQAIVFLNKAIDISNSAKNFSLIAQIKQNKAYALTKLGRYDEAEKLFTEAESAAKANNNTKEIFSEIYNHWSTLDSARGNFKAALFNRNRYLILKDSILNINLSKQVNELQTKYETEKKQKQIEILNHQTAIQQLKLTQSKLQVDNQQLLLEQSKLHIANQNLDLDKKQALLTQRKLEAERKQQQITLLNKQNKIQKLAIQKRNTTIGIVSGSLLMVLILAALFYNRYKLKQEARLQAEVIHQQTIAAKGIIEAEERERKRIAADLHDGVGQTFSAVRLNLASLLGRIDISKTDDAALADKTMALVDESCKEVRTIAHQMMPNILLKMGLSSAVKDFINKIDADKLKVTLETSGLNERLDSNTEIVLYRVLQECVNNVIKHAEATRLDIQLDRDEGGISAMVEDNGKGFNTDKQENFEGIGLKNIITRLTYLKGTVDFSSAPGKGTLVAIYVPLTSV